MDVENATVEQLKARLKELEAQVANMHASTSQHSTSRPKIAQMSSEVVDSNPYSRLMALKRMGIVDNYEVYIEICFGFPIYPPVLIYVE